MFKMVAFVDDIFSISRDCMGEAITSDYYYWNNHMHCMKHGSVQMSVFIPGAN